MSYLKKYQFWLNQKDLDPTLLNELISLNEEQIEEVFGTDLSFGTGGLRGLLGVGSNRVNIYTIRKATLGFARYIKKNHIPGNVAIAYDNRHFSKEFAKEAAMVLAAQGIGSYVYQDLRPTPMLSYAVRYFKCAGGIMITASHNPKSYNGYKAYDQTGAQLNPKDADRVIDEINQVDNPFEIETIENDLIQYIDLSMDDVYLNEVKTIQLNKVDKPVKIVYSPLHGTGKDIIPKLLKDEGYLVYPYTPQMIADPNFSNTDSSNPEEKEAYIGSISYAKEINAPVVMVTDPDADRLGIAVYHDGEYHLLSGNQTATIELYYILTQLKAQNKLPKNGFVYTTNVTTDMIKTIATDFNIEVQTTLTGFKFIGELAELNQDKGPYIFGCEESYGSLIKDFVRDKDAVQAVYMLAEIVNYVDAKGQTLIDYLDEIYQTYGYYYEYTASFMFQGLSGIEKMNQMMDHYRKNPPQIESKKLLAYDDIISSIRFENGVETKLDYPKSNVLKYYYEDNTWIVFRPSGTEPKLKVYLGTKDQSMEKAKTFVHQTSDQLKKQIDAL
ncbi:phospho-sugar mutase [Peloplasma aerotolerans]|uniref:Phospho-sugar mutase n=1 Tax=Peloplasma aerotolerans TaxID=3044389 RepID=A0AAW6U8G1_9MOLU|nr:phospho-sugar mutase [Mariniplasma sp. M4Ah]MDI6451974.1 phospho-sugar mutase [Mariniplasma sp. M4Ah]